MSFTFRKKNCILQRIFNYRQLRGTSPLRYQRRRTRTTEIYKNLDNNGNILNILNMNIKQLLKNVKSLSYLTGKDNVLLSKKCCSFVILLDFLTLFSSSFCISSSRLLKKFKENILCYPNNTNVIILQKLISF